MPLMKRIIAASIIIAVSLITSRASMAQDIIHTYDSAPIKAKVLDKSEMLINITIFTLLGIGNDTTGHCSRYLTA